MTASDQPGPHVPPSTDPDRLTPPEMKRQRAGRVVAVLDGDADAHVWEPNGGEDRLDLDLTPMIALLIDAGLGATPEHPAHWRGSESSKTILVGLEIGAAGYVTVDGSLISDDAAARLMTNGFMDRLRTGLGMYEALSASEPSESDADGSPDTVSGCSNTN